jgi:exopolysaccharide biosynthesis polyprenyl glycosylphosphotransferase
LVSIGGAVLAVVALAYCGAYRVAVLGSSGRTLGAIVMAMGLACPAVLALYFGVQLPTGFVGATAHTGAIFLPALFLSRAFFRGISSWVTERVILVGAGHLGVEVARVLRERPNMGLELVGLLSDDDEMQGESIEGFRVIGRVDEIEKLLIARQIDRILVCTQDRDAHFPAEQLLAAKFRGCRIDSALTFLERTTGQIHPRGLRTSYLIFSDGFHSGVVSDAVKRVFDVLVSSSLLFLASPVLALAALAIRIDSPGPILYRQTRVGKGGREFRVLKLRSMMDGAEEDTGAVLATSEDQRVTRVGRILRMTRLDEVPQFWNVLRGEMSVVGPRPERPEFVEILTERCPLFHLRSTVKPGVTGWAQICFGYVNELDSFEQKLSLDLFYLKYRSLSFDLLILWSTIKTVVLFRGL